MTDGANGAPERCSEPGGGHVVEDLVWAIIGYLLATPMAYRSAPMKWVETARSLFVSARLAPCVYKHQVSSRRG